jgi:hypothetical protein
LYLSNLPIEASCAEALTCKFNTMHLRLDCPYQQCFFVDPNVCLAPDAAFGAAMLASVPFTFALRFDAGAVQRKV